MFKKIGPGVLVAAAFVGPGTITMCTLAGARFGYALVWALVVSIIATIVLQGMAGRIGLATQNGLVAVVGGEQETGNGRKQKFGGSERIWNYYCGLCHIPWCKKYF